MRLGDARKGYSSVMTRIIYAMESNAQQMKTANTRINLSANLESVIDLNEKLKNGLNNKTFKLILLNSLKILNFLNIHNSTNFPNKFKIKIKFRIKYLRNNVRLCRKRS